MVEPCARTLTHEKKQKYGIVSKHRHKRQARIGAEAELSQQCTEYGAYLLSFGRLNVPDGTGTEGREGVWDQLL